MSLSHVEGHEMMVPRLHAMLDRHVGVLRQHYCLRREKDETLHEFAGRIRSVATLEGSEALATWYAWWGECVEPVSV